MDPLGSGVSAALVAAFFSGKARNVGVGAP
jgi:hypothetical protein